MKRVRIALIAIGIWLLPAAGQNPVFQSETRIVEVAIMAHASKDEPVTDLTADDFRVFDNGVEQKILSFDKLWEPPHAANGLPIGLPPKRPTVVLIDYLHMGQSEPVRQALIETLKTFPQGQDHISIYTLGDELKVLKGFTPYTMGLRMAVGEQAGETPSIPSGNRFLWTLKAMTTIAADLKKIPGEKNLVWLVGGFPIESFEDVAQAMRELAADQVVLYPVDVRGLRLLPPPRGMDRLPWQQNPDGRGSAGPTASFADPGEGMYSLAELTGGRVFDDSNDLPGLIRAAMEDSRDGYLLTYAPNNYQKDGSGHEVRLKTERKGLDLRYRPGYFADAK